MLITTLKQFIEDLAKKQDEEISKFLIELGFLIEEIPIQALPIDTMLKNYLMVMLKKINLLLKDLRSIKFFTKGMK